MQPRQKKSVHSSRFVFFASLILAVLAWGAYACMFVSLRSAAEEATVLAAESAKLEQEQSKEVELKHDLAANQARQPVLDSYFVDASDPVPLFETLEGYGRTTNVIVSIDAVDVKKSPNRLVVSLGGKGSFADVYRFIALVEAAPYEFSVTDASVRIATPLGTDATHKPSAAVWEAHLTLSVTSVTGVPATAAQK